MMDTRFAEASDAKRISALLTANSNDRGGMLLGAWPVEVIEGRILNNQPIVAATDEDGELLGALLTSEKVFADTPPVRVMLNVWPGDAGAYVYGPVCVASEARGRGVLEAMYAKIQTKFADREAILFIREDNPRSLHAHLRLGMRVVARFELEGEVFLVLSDKSDSCL
jgi:hypothetical protein